MLFEAPLVPLAFLLVNPPPLLRPPLVPLVPLAPLAPWKTSRN